MGLVANVDTCYTDLDWETGVDGGKNGPMGEDLFAQRCMDLHGVKHIEDFSITADGEVLDVFDTVQVQRSEEEQEVPAILQGRDCSNNPPLQETSRMVVMLAGGPAVSCNQCIGSCVLSLVRSSNG